MREVMTGEIWAVSAPVTLHSPADTAYLLLDNITAHRSVLVPQINGEI